MTKKKRLFALAFFPPGHKPLKVQNVEHVFDECVFLKFHRQNMNIEFDIGEMKSIIVVCHLSQKLIIKMGSTKHQKSSLRKRVIIMACQ